MREYRVIDAWKPRGKNAGNGSISSGGTVVLLMVKFQTEISHPSLGIKLLLAEIPSALLKSQVSYKKFQKKNICAIEHISSILLTIVLWRSTHK